MRILGIDPGLTGGLAIIDLAGRRVSLIDAVDIPTTGDKAKRRVDVGELCRFWRKHFPIDYAFIERAQAMPKQGSSSGFIYGRAVGALEATVEALEIPITVIESTAWKKFHGLLKTSKEDDRQRAIQLFPGNPFMPLHKHHGRAEAALIARFGALALIERAGNNGDSGETRGQFSQTNL